MNNMVFYSPIKLSNQVTLIYYHRNSNYVDGTDVIIDLNGIVRITGRIVNYYRKTLIVNRIDKKEKSDDILWKKVIVKDIHLNANRFFKQLVYSKIKLKIFSDTQWNIKNLKPIIRKCNWYCPFGIENYLKAFR